MPMHPFDEFRQFQTRRQFFGRATTGVGIGAAALASLLDAGGAAAATPAEGIPGVLTHPPLAPKARRVIYLFMQGGPSQMDLFDDKPHLRARHGEDLPASIRMSQRLTTMSSNQKTLPVAPSP